MAKQIVTPNIDEISGVDHPAHLTEGWLLMKDASSETALLLAKAEAVANGVDPNTITIEDIEKAKAAFVEAEKADEKANENEKIEPAGDKPNEKVTKMADGVSTEPTEAEVFEKAVASLPEEARAVLIKSQREGAEAKALAKALFDKQENERFEAMAKSLTSIPGITAEVAPDLRKAAEAIGDEAFDRIFKALKAADVAVAKSALFSEIGSAAAAAADSGQAALEAIAKEIQAKEPDISDAEALTKAVEANPDLYAQHRGEYIRSQKES